MELLTSTPAVRKLAALVVTTLILVALYSQMEISKLAEAIGDIRWGWFFISMLLFVPIFWIRAVRLNDLLDREPGLTNSLRTILAGSSLSLVLPSKAGDLAKAIFIKRYVSASTSTCTATVIYERVIDTAALTLILFLGLAFVDDQRPFVTAATLGGLGIVSLILLYFFLHLWPPAQSWAGSWQGRISPIGHHINNSCQVVKDLVRDQRMPMTVAYSTLLWLVHLGQFYCFFQATSFSGPDLAVVAYVPAAIIFGLLPITVAGIGTRDLALIALFAPWASQESLALVGLLSHLRFILPGIAGLWLSHSYMSGQK